MKLRRGRYTFAALLVLLTAPAGPGHAADVTMTLPKGFVATNIGTSSLVDPSGATHTRQDVAGRVVVAIFSAPNMTQGGRQEKWSDLLSTQADTKVSDKVALVLVEDMTQAGMFRGMALDDMKKQFSPKERPFLILDETGAVFKKFGMPENKTGILIYDKKGNLKDAEIDLDDQKTVITRIQAITKKLLAQ
jgi:predicted transcriptional regulator